jgi:hypothetical protein
MIPVKVHQYVVRRWGPGCWVGRCRACCMVYSTPAVELAWSWIDDHQGIYHS